MILTTVKTGAGDTEDLAHDQGRAAAHGRYSVTDAGITTPPVPDADAPRRIPGPRHPLAAGGPRRMTRLEGEKDASERDVDRHPCLQPLVARLGLANARFQDRHHHHHPHRVVVETISEGIRLYRPTEVTGAVEELGTNDHLPVQEFMLMKIRSNVREAYPDPPVGAEAGAGLVTGSAIGVWRSRARISGPESAVLIGRGRGSEGMRGSRQGIVRGG